MSYHHHHSSQGPPPPPPPPSAPTHSSNPAYYHPSSLPSSQQQQQQQGRGTPNSNSSNGAGPYGQMPPSSNSPYGQLTHDGQHQQQQPPSHHQQQSNSPYQPPMTSGYASHPGYSSMPGTSGHHQQQPGHPQGGYPSAGYPEHAPHLPPPPPHYATHGGYPGTGYGHVPGASDDMYHQHHQLQQQGHHVPPPPPHHHQPYHAGSNEPPSMAPNARAGSSSSPGGVGGPSNGSGSNNNSGHSSSRNDDPRGQHPDLPAGMRPKRRQVKNACVNCQKACKKCDEGRPCGRCVKYGLSDTCFDSTRKERKRGIKRGPYKRRNTGTNAGASGSGSTAGNGSNGAPAGSSTTTTSAPSGNNASASLDAQHHAHHVGQQPSPSYIKSESGPYEGSHYDVNGPTPYSNPSSYRSLAPFASNNSSNNANNGNHNGGGYSSSSSSGGPPAPPQQSNMSPSLFQRDQPRSQAVNAIVNHHASVANNQLGNNNGNGNDGVTQSGGSRGAWTGPHILTNNNEALSRLPWGHSTALPLGQQQQQQNNTQYTQQSPIYNVSALPGAGSSSSSGGYALPSPSLLNNGPRSATLPSSTSSLFSPPTLPSTGSSGYLSAFASGLGGHQRFTSDSNLQQHHGGHHQHSASTPSIASAGGSSGSSAAFSSPRTPLSANPLHSLGGSQHSLPTSSNVGSMDPPMSTSSNNSYIKSPASYVHHPQPLMGSGAGATRPFPLHLPQFPKYSNSQGNNNGGAYGTAK